MSQSNIFILIIFLILFNICFIGCTDVNPTDKTIYYVNYNGTNDYLNIQDAINKANDNFTIYVYSGIYNETLIINKTINLVGENPATTVIRGNHTNDVVTITSTLFCKISGFTIQDSGVNRAGINILTGHNNISNNIFQENYDGIIAQNNDLNIISDNTFRSNDRYGIYLSGSDFNRVERNIFINNSYGIRVKALDNLIIGNTFHGNERGLYFCCNAENNLVYHNNFFNNSYYNAIDTKRGEIWYNKEIREGNYWDDYLGPDNNKDSIGDFPYNITQDGSKQDIFPLMKPWKK